VGILGRAFTGPVDAAGTGAWDESAGVGAGAAVPGAFTVMVGGAGAPADMLMGVLVGEGWWWDVGGNEGEGESVYCGN